MARRLPFPTRRALAAGVAGVLAIALAASPALAQHRFGGGGIRAGDFHGGGGFHGGSFRGNAPSNFNAPGSGGGGIRNPNHAGPPPHPPGPGPSPSPPTPGPGPHPPGPGPGPHPPGPPPGPGPHPPGPPPGPGPRPPYPPPPPPPGWGWGWGWDDDPFWDVAAAGVIAGTTAAVIDAADEPDVVVVQSPTTIGTVVTTLPGNCTRVAKGASAYFDCGNVWYLPQYVSSGVTYVIVAPPP